MININSKTNLIRNDGFENVVLKPFYICSKYNYSSLNLLPRNSNQHSGRYAFCYKSTFYIDYLIQNLNTTKGQIYNISFWIKNRSAPVNKLTVAIICICFFLSFLCLFLIRLYINIINMR
jgi:hypothetical protein